MNFGNEDNSYFGGIPSSIISYSTDRGRYQAYDGVYDIQSGTTQQLITLQNQITDLQKKIVDVQSYQAVQTQSDNPNYIANGDCSQFTLPYPVTMSQASGANAVGFNMHGAAVPVQDRWYHVAELSGFNPVNIKCEVKKVQLSSYISGTPDYGTVPSLSYTGVSVKYSNAAAASSPIITLEHTKGSGSWSTQKYGGMMGIQHMVPDLKNFINKSFTLGFWLYCTQSNKAYVHIMRQYNIANGGSNGLTADALERITLQEFSYSSGWNYITVQFNVGALKNKAIDTENNGLVIQIGPCYYTWSNSSGTAIVQKYGSETPMSTNSPTLELVLAEIQLRSDLIPSAMKLNYPYNPNEEQRTLPYVGYCSSLKPEQVNNKILSAGNERVINVGPVHNVPRNGIYTDWNIDYYVPLPISAPMIRAPTVTIYSYYTKSGSTVTPKIGTVWVNNPEAPTEYSSINSNTYTGKLTTLSDLTGLNIDFGSFIQTNGGGLTTPTYTPSGTSGSYNLDMINVSNTLQIFRGHFNGAKAYTYDDYPSMCRLRTFKTSENKWGWFTFIVPEVHLGNGYDGTLWLVDYSWTCITTRPF